MKTATKHITTDTGKVFVSYRPGKNSPTDLMAVFVHGWGGDQRVWSEIVQSCRLSSLSVDLPGFGGSDMPPRSLDVEDYADVLDAVIRKCELQKVVLIGHSFGGQIATALAARQPQWLAGLVLVGSASLREASSPLLSRLGAVLGPVFRLPLLRQLRPLIYKLLGADTPPTNPVLRDTMRKALRADQRDRLADITVPTQLIWGDNDTATPLTEGRKIHSLIPEATLTVLTGGHYIFIDQPTAFIDTLSAFINRIS